MGPAVTWTLVSYALALGLLAGLIGARLRRPRSAPGALAMLAVLSFGGLATSASAWVRCFEGGALRHPEILGPSLAAWALAALPLVWTLRRLTALTRQARRRPP